MKEEQLFEQMKMWRGWTVELLKTVPHGIVDEIPNGFRNNIRWNAGHILAGWDHTMFPAVGMERQLPLSYHLMFPRGSKPADWTEEPPSMDELIQRLEEQPQQIEEACKGHLEDPLEEPFLHMTTLGEMFVFHMAHENLHVGTINSMKKTLETGE
ncbi:MAG TPA: DinB family protein [Bacillales bacterium]|nr:DinB family protein [Bacillales bacterium]